MYGEKNIETHIIFIQAQIRSWLARKKFTYIKTILNQLPLCVNETTFSGDLLSELNPEKLYILQDGTQYYGFDLKEIWEWLYQIKRSTNPYTNNQLSEETMKQIASHFSLDSYNTNNTNHTNHTNHTNDTPNENNYNTKLTDFFIKIEELGCYANMEGYKMLTTEQLWTFIYSLYQEYELVQAIVNMEDVEIIQKNWSQVAIDPTEVTILEFKMSILNLFNKIYQTIDDKKEELALIFTLHLSKTLSPNNDELEHYYLHNINYLIERIIEYNMYTNTETNSDWDYEESLKDDDESE